jgi:DtxR family Mn-dependent transcriptional regulator
VLTESIENYLTEILKLEEAGETATTGALAGRLAVARPSVTGMLKRLADEGLVEHRPYRGARLTPAGRHVALEVRRRHRLVETFLVQRLGMDPGGVHDEAHRWEHVISPEVLDRLDEYLGRPERCPHGSPIPRPGKAAP